MTTLIPVFKARLIVSEDGHKIIWYEGRGRQLEDLIRTCGRLCGATKFVALLDLIENETNYRAGSKGESAVVAVPPVVDAGQVEAVQAELTSLSSNDQWGPGLDRFLNMFNNDDGDIYEWSVKECTELIDLASKLQTAMDLEIDGLGRTNKNGENGAEQGGWINWEQCIVRFEKGLQYCVDREIKAHVGIFQGPRKPRGSESFVEKMNGEKDDEEDDDDDYEEDGEEESVGAHDQEEVQKAN